MVPSSSASSMPSPPPTCMESPIRFDSSLPSSSLEAAPKGLPLAPADEAVRGLIPITTHSFAVPGGSYGFLNFYHALGCRNAMFAEFDNAIQLMVISTVPTTVKEVEVAVQAYLLERGCSATCGLDKDSTTGLLMQFHSDRRSIHSPSLLSSPTADSQAIVPELSLRSSQKPAPTLVGKAATSGTAPKASKALLPLPARQSSILDFAVPSSLTPSW